MRGILITSLVVASLIQWLTLGNDAISMATASPPSP